MDSDTVVIKVGGSLFDLPGLGPRLAAWLPTLGTRALLLVPGGGPAANVVRAFDRLHALGEEAAHWLALRALSRNATVLAQLLAPLGAVVVDGPEAAPECWQTATVPIVDGYLFARGDDGRPGALPHSWCVAIRARAQRLILLKSITIPEGVSWAEAGRRGWVDEHFDTALARGRFDALTQLQVRAVNFRSTDPPGGSPC
jgi:hypothetical protein